MKKDFLFEKFLAYLRYKKVVKHILKNSTVCDIGCGFNAQFLKKISPLIKQGFGFDKNVQNYENSKFKLKKIKILNQIPLFSETIDIVTMLAVLEHLKNPQRILNECFRILRKNGELILTTPTPLAKPILEFLSFKLNLINSENIKEHKNYFHPDAIKQMLIQAGFKNTNIKSKYFEFGFNNLIIAKKIK